MPVHRWQKCARKTLGTHDWICKVALSSKVIMTIVLGRKKMMQLMTRIRYNRIKQFETPINSNITDSLLINFTGSPRKKGSKGHPAPAWKLSPFGPPPL